MLLMIGAATCFATGSLLQRRLAGTPIMTIYGWTGLMGLVMLLPLSLLLEPQAPGRLLHLQWQMMGWFAFSVLGSTLMGQGGLTWRLGRHPVSAVMPLTLMATVVSVVASHLMLGTPITLLMALGGIMTLVGVSMVTLRGLSPVRLSSR
jgi:O-acetylserine/cysteine efflux transporter